MLIKLFLTIKTTSINTQYVIITIKTSLDTSTVSLGMFSLHINSYLQSRSSGIDSHLLNLLVNNARNNPLLKQQHDYPASADTDDPITFNSCPKLASAQPHHPIIHADVTRRPLAFTHELQLRKLMRELHSRDENDISIALASLCDVLHDPERAYVALRLRMVNHLGDLMREPSAMVRERCCGVINVLAGCADGKLTITRNPTVVFNIRKILNDSDRYVRLIAAELVRTISGFWLSADDLIENGFIPLILQHIAKSDQNTFIEVLQDTLVLLMYNMAGRQAAHQYDAFSILLARLKHLAHDQIVAKSLRGLAMLLHLPECKRRALDDDVDLLKTVNVLLAHVNPDVHNAAAEVAMFATIKMRAKVAAVRFPFMPKRLVELAGNCHNETSQTYAIKALTNIGEYPPLRLLIYRNYIAQIKAIPVNSQHVKMYKDVLLRVVTNISNLGQDI